jgi:DNA-binding LacI/PurR family transcriptional regulator
MDQVSIKDIARAASVSHPTVSRALRNSPLVNRETAERIQSIAAVMGYRPNKIARSLVTKRTYTIGVVVTSIADPFIGEVVSGIEAVANEHGYSVVLSNSNADPDLEVKVVHSFQERRVDAVIVTASRVGALYLDLLSRLKIPIVLINNQHEDDADFIYSVRIDNLTASQAAMRHLIYLGHRRIGYIGDVAGFQSDTERHVGYRAALAAVNLPYLKELVSHGDGKPEGGRDAMERLLDLDRQPTAVFCYNDMSALGAMRAIHARGLIVPDDISIIGFDDLFLASYANPLLTTIRQPMRQMGRLAMETVLKIISGDRSTTNIKVQGELIIRDSTAQIKRCHC